MLLLAGFMQGASVQASDGKIGKLCDFLFDERDGSIRHLVLDGGTWLNRAGSLSRQIWFGQETGTITSSPWQD